MTLSPLSNTTLATLTQSNLTRRVQDLAPHQFANLLNQITDEFEHFLKAIELINNEALETMLEQILEAFTLKIGQILQAERTTIFLVDEEKDQLWSKVAQGDSDEKLELRIPLKSGIAGYVVATGKPLNIPDAYKHPLFNPEVDQQTGYLTRNLLCMPIVNRQQQVVAVAQLLNRWENVCPDQIDAPHQYRPFDEEDEEQFCRYADAVGIILESCNSFYIAARKQRGAAALLKATTFLAQSLDLEKTLQAVMNEARQLMQADRSTLFLLDRDKGELWSKVAKADGQTMLEIRIPINRGIAGFVASTGQIVNIPNAYDDPRFDPTTDRLTGYLTRTMLCMPVYNSERTLIGVTQLINKHQGAFNNSDEEFMGAFNIQAGIALENAQLFERVLLEKQYQKDILESLSDAVISTDLEGRIVTINDAALALLGCPLKRDGGKQQQIWIKKLIGRQVWDIVPIENLRSRLEDSFKHGARQYVPEQSLTASVYQMSDATSVPALVPPFYRPDHPDLTHILVGIASLSGTLQSGRPTADYYLPWNDPAQPSVSIPAQQVRQVEHSVNLTVNPLTNPEGKVRGGLVVLEDISQEKRMKATMYRYMTPGVAERVMALGEDALMVGERRDVTILFSDIRGYTSLTEQMEAADVVSLLNNYFETMVEAVFNYEGTLDKFIGDALMAVFGAPLPLSNHAWMSVQAALDMRRRLAEFNQKRRLASQPLIRIGIGISSGEVVSGNIGSQKRMDYTVIGDGVDISSRLEGVTKEYGCDIILSEYTYNLCRENVWVRELDRIRVKGKNQPVSIYELLGDRSSPLDPVTQEFLMLYDAGRNAYMNAYFKDAIRYFKAAEQINKSDRAVQVHLERSHTYLQNPPPVTWDGVHTMMTK